MGTWNPSRDREPDKKEEQLFKQFLITKYERKQWYKSPAEVKREEATPEKEVKVEAKIQPPPASKVRKIFFMCVCYLYTVEPTISDHHGAKVV